MLVDGASGLTVRRAGLSQRVATASQGDDSERTSAGGRQLLAFQRRVVEEGAVAAETASPAQLGLFGQRAKASCTIASSCGRLDSTLRYSDH